MTETFRYPKWAYRFQEVVFKGLPATDRLNWHIEFAEKAEKIKDWPSVKRAVILTSLKIALPHDQHNVVQPVIDLWAERVPSGDPRWLKAAAEARVAEARVVEARVVEAESTEAWAAYAAYAAAYETETAASAWAAARAARAAAAAEAEAEAGGDAWRAIRDAFLNAG